MIGKGFVFIRLCRTFQPESVLLQPHCIAVPLIDFTGATGSSVQVTVMGFAMMWLGSYTSDSPCEVRYLGQRAYRSGCLQPGADVATASRRLNSCGERSSDPI
jgi:hypothetical protein